MSERVSMTVVKGWRQRAMLDPEELKYLKTNRHIRARRRRSKEEEKALRCPKRS